MRRIAGIFIAGLLAALPLAVTLFIAGWLVATITDYAGPESRFGRYLTSLGLGVDASGAAPYVLGLAILLAAIFVLGLLVESRLGDFLSHVVDRIIMRIPVVSNVYSLSRRFVSLVDTSGGDSLKSMSAVWCFFGGDEGAAVLALMPSSKPVRLGSEDYVGILVPSAPVPVGGGLIYVPSRWVRPAAGGVEQLMSVYVSMGVTPPSGLKA